MYVEQIMTRAVDTVTADMKLSHAAQVMREKGRRYLPVVDDKKHLIGLFSQKELDRAEPSAITTLSVGEVNYLTSKITVGELMVREVITCSSDTLVEEAGKMIRDKKIGNLPVIDNGELVGVVSETDILDFFLDIMGCGLENTTRIAVSLPNKARALAGLLHKINDAGGYIATVVSPVSQMDSPERIAVVRYIADNPEALDDHLEEIGYELITEVLPNP
jgi:acetoin utilization protein AcuB